MSFSSLDSSIISPLDYSTPSTAWQHSLFLFSHHAGHPWRSVVGLGGRDTTKWRNPTRRGSWTHANSKPEAWANIQILETFNRDWGNELLKLIRVKSMNKILQTWLFLYIISLFLVCMCECVCFWIKLGVSVHACFVPRHVLWIWSRWRCCGDDFVAQS